MTRPELDYGGKTFEEESDDSARALGWAVLAICVFFVVVVAAVAAAWWLL